MEISLLYFQPIYQKLLSHILPSLCRERKSRNWNNRLWHLHSLVRGLGLKWHVWVKFTKTLSSSPPAEQSWGSCVYRCVPLAVVSQALKWMLFYPDWTVCVERSGEAAQPACLEGKLSLSRCRCTPKYYLPNWRLLFHQRAITFHNTEK